MLLERKLLLLDCFTYVVLSFVLKSQLYPWCGACRASPASQMCSVCDFSESKGACSECRPTFSSFTAEPAFLSVSAFMGKVDNILIRIKFQNLSALSRSALLQMRYNVSHICNLKFSSAHFKKRKEMHEINFNNVLFNSIYRKYYCNMLSIFKNY